MNDLVTTNASDLAQFIVGSQKTGFENMDSSCIARPYLQIAQAMSEMATKGNPNYIPGLEPGMFYSPTTKKVFGRSVDVCVLKFIPEYAIWGGIDSSGRKTDFRTMIDKATFEREYSKNYKWDPRYNALSNSNGEIAIEQFDYILMFPGSIEEGLYMFSLKSIGIPVGRKWNTMALNIKVNLNGAMRQAPIWASVWRLTTGLDQNKKGSSFQITQIERIGFVSKNIAPVVAGAFSELEDFTMQVVDEHESMPSYVEETFVPPEQKVKSVFGAPAQPPKPDMDIF